jgi:hypothetical protein
VFSIERESVKIRVEFHPYKGDKPVDLESQFQVVELTTAYAGTYDDWGDALRDLASTAGNRWNKEKILASAVLLNGGDDIDWEWFVEQMSDSAASALRETLSRKSG